MSLRAIEKMLGLEKAGLSLKECVNSDMTRETKECEMGFEVMDTDPLRRVELAIEDIRAGKR